MRPIKSLAIAFLVAVACAQTKPANDPTVHITKTGTKYHSAGCQYLRKSDITIKLSEAKARHLTPCSKCKPPR